MKKFNINDNFYIQINEKGWEHLKKTVGHDYIKHCILPYKVKIGDEDWYKLQCHVVFELLPITFGEPVLFSTNILLDENEMEDYEPPQKNNS